MQDVPPEISVALAVVQSLTASGRCREDAGLYASAAALVKQYLDAAIRPAQPPAPLSVAPAWAPAVTPAPAPPAAAPPSAAVPAPESSLPPAPRPDAVWNPAAGCFVVPRVGAAQLPVPPNPSPRPDAVWHDAAGSWLVPRPPTG